jgi:hypothetical protein
VAEVLKKQGRYEEAIVYYKVALEETETIAGGFGAVWAHQTWAPQDDFSRGAPLGPPLALTRLTRGLAVGKGYRQALVVMCPPAGVLSTAPQVSRDAMGWCEEASLTLTLTPTPTLTLMEQQSVATPHRP